MKKNPWRRKCESGKFRPDRKMIKREIERYFKKGGEITVLDPGKRSQTSNNETSFADEFLMGGV